MNDNMTEVVDEMPKMKGGNSKWRERYEKRKKMAKEMLTPEEEQIVRMFWLKEHIIDE